MDNGDRNGEERIREAIREATRSGRSLGRRGNAPLLVALAAIALLLPPLAFLAYLTQTPEFAELGNFLSWLVDCMGADCP